MASAPAIARAVAAAIDCVHGVGGGYLGRHCTMAASAPLDDERTWMTYQTLAGRPRVGAVWCARGGAVLCCFVLALAGTARARWRRVRR